MAMLDPSGKMHKNDLVDALTDMVVKAVTDPKSTEFGTLAKINNVSALTRILYQNKLRDCLLTQ